MLWIPLTRYGVRLPRLLSAMFAAFIGALMSASMLSGIAAAEEPKNEESTESDSPKTPLERPDGVSAAIAAQLEKKPVEDLSKRTESTRTFVNPDGTLTDESFGTAVRVESDRGVWEDVDYNLAEQSDGSYAPKVAAQDLTISGGDSKEAARVGFDDGSSLAVTLPENLPEPTIDGGVATYKLSEATDLIVAVTGSGVATRLRLNEKPAEDDPVFTFGLRADDLDIAQTASGGLKLTEDGNSLGSTSTLVAWDARTDKAGQPSNMVPLEADLTKVSTSGDVTKHELDLTAPEGFLDDPETVYPVIIDPDINALTFAQDTWVRSGYTAGLGGLSFLVVGKSDGAHLTGPAYSYLQWANSQIAGKTVVKATMGLHQYFAASCDPKSMGMSPVTSSWSEAGTVWTNQPSYSSSTGHSVYQTTNRGVGCPDGAGIVNTDITLMAQAWGLGTYANYGLLMTTNATDGSFERRFCSSEPDTSMDCDSATKVPALKVTYNGAPNVPATPSSLSAARTWNDKLYVASLAPYWSTAGTDNENSRLWYQFEEHSSTAGTSGSLIGSCTTATIVYSGTTASCKPSGTLTNGSTYYVRARSKDAYGLYGAWGAWRTFVVDRTVPTVPTMTCTGVADKTWYEAKPASSTTCTVAGNGADIEYQVDRKTKTALATSDTTPAIILRDVGYTNIEVRSRTRAGVVSAWRRVGFGTGPASLLAPIQDDRSSSSFPVEAAAPVGADSAKVQWRFAPDDEGDNTTGWTDATAVKKASDGTTWSGTVSGDDWSTTPKLVWDPQSETGISSTALVQARVRFTYPGDVTKDSPFQRVQIVPHAFGGSFPTDTAGPGEVALFTGEFQMSETDVSVPGYGDDLTLGRSHLSLAGVPAGPAGVFGPGWKADLSGPDTGTAGYAVDDRTATDGSIVLNAPEGDSYVYRHSSGTNGAQQAGSYIGVGETAGEEDKLTLATVTGETGVSHRLTLTEWDGAKTIFVRTNNVWTTEKVIGVEENSTTTYAHDGDGSVTWIFAATPNGVDCDATSQEPGCRALHLNYTATGTAKRLTSVDLRIWDPETGSNGLPGSGAGMETVTVAKYAYTDGKLAGTWDPRIADGAGALKTQYAYDTIAGKTVLTDITEPGVKAWKIHYATTGTDIGKLTKVTRAQDAAVGTGDATWTIKYGIPLSSTGDGLPDLSSTATATWGQQTADAPVAGAAVFGPDRIPASTPSAGDNEYASLSYWTKSGRVTNTAQFGADAWQIESQRYDEQGNTVWDLDAGARNKALAEGTTSEETAGAADKYATLTVYNSTGTRVEETYSPTREFTRDDGTLMIGRTLTQTVYDNESDAAGLVDGRPTVDVPADGYGLAVEERSSETDKSNPGASGSLYDTTKTRYRYDPIITGDGDGWELKTPTRILVQEGSGWSTTTSRFDDEGKVFEIRTPQSTEATGSAATARTTQTVHYTADTSASRNECDNKPQWAGETCWTGTAGAPSSGAAIPSTTTTGYSMLLSPSRVEEGSGSAARISISGFDAAGRQTTSSQTTSGLSPTDRAVATTTTSYSASTGAVTSVTNGTQIQTTGYDSWGRTVSQTDGTGNTATTSYDTAGRVQTANDGKGTYTYTYDGTDSDGKKERRGLVTKLDVGLPSGPDEFTGAYNADGALIEQNYPGGTTANWTRDITGAETELTYSQNGVPILAFSSELDADGRVRGAKGPNSEQTYTYDDRDRLSKVTDTAGGVCVTRKYEFSKDSNRESLKTYDTNSAGDCQETTIASTVNSSFDDADRITTTGYTYDPLGRTATVPASHTNNPAGSVLAVGYHANDMVATTSQTVTEGGASVTKAQDYTLDINDRISTTKSLTAGVSLAESTNHYDGTDDSPAWTESKTRPNASSAWANNWTRNIVALGGDMGIIQASDGTAKIQLANLHDDVIATANLNAAGINEYTEYTEYGRARDPKNTVARYGWVGAKQREATATGGLTLMGARLYNPATGRFLSRDSVAGGNDNTYIYPADPINKADLTGQWWSRKKWRRIGRISNRIQSSALGWGYSRVARATGGSCGRRYGMRVCKSRFRIYGAGGTTIGNTYVTGRRGSTSRDRMKHEKRHRAQWSRYGAKFGLMYGREVLRSRGNPKQNRWEKKAGLKCGGYTRKGKCR